LYQHYCQKWYNARYCIGLLHMKPYMYLQSLFQSSSPNRYNWFYNLLSTTSDLFTCWIVWSCQIRLQVPLLPSSLLFPGYIYTHVVECGRWLGVVWQVENNRKRTNQTRRQRALRLKPAVDLLCLPDCRGLWYDKSIP
jgi:hypothetical protein